VHIPENWYIHQLQTTSNFAVGNRFVTQAIGGLNYQIEHHLFPSMCHVHYPEIAPIVQKTCEEFGLPYHQLPSVRAAVSGHFTVLKNLGL
jgi:linoleoyl-CoA desaturase